LIFLLLPPFFDESNACFCRPSGGPMPTLPKIGVDMNSSAINGVGDDPPGKNGLDRLRNLEAIFLVTIL
jgi:hypothetical protein